MFFFYNWRVGRLIWVNVIFKSEIYFKFGGDVGGGLFKMVFQIVNLDKLNLKINIVVFSMFNVKDFWVNFKIVLL